MCVQNTNRAQTIFTVMLRVQNTDKQNTDKQNTDNSHCHFVCVERSWAVTWTRPSAVPTTPCGNCSSRTERGTSTVCDTAAYWSVGTDPSRLFWHQDGQTLTQWGAADHTPTADRRKRAKLQTSPSSFIALRYSVFPSSLFSLTCLLPSCLLCSLCLVFFFVLSVLPSSFLSSLYPCLVFFSVLFVLSVLSFSFLSSLYPCLVFFSVLFVLCLVFFLPVFFVLSDVPFFLLSSVFSLSCLFPSCVCSRCLVVFFLFRSVVLCTQEKLSWLEQCSKARCDLYFILNYKETHKTSETETKSKKIKIKKYNKGQGLHWLLSLSTINYCHRQLTKTTINYCHRQLTKTTINYCHKQLAKTTINYCHRQLTKTQRQLLITVTDN